MKAQKKYAVCALLILLAVVADQWSKIQIISRFAYAERLNIIPGFFDLTLVYNPGAAFSFLAGAGGWQKYFFLILALVICAYLITAVVRNEFGITGSFGAALIVGGAAGNVIDRLLHGHVIDFLLFYLQNHYYPTFNIADSCICVGAVLLIWDSLKNKKKTSDKNQQAA